MNYIYHHHLDGTERHLQPQSTPSNTITFKEGSPSPVIDLIISCPSTPPKTAATTGTSRLAPPSRSLPTESIPIPTLLIISSRTRLVSDASQLRAQSLNFPP